MKPGTATAICILLPFPALAQGSNVGSVPPADAVPRVEFAFEERVTLKGRVLSGGFDFQLTYTASDCTQLSAD
jgi:hypothetical protein